MTGWDRITRYERLNGGGPKVESSPDRLSTGVKRLDEILNGGLIPGRAYLARGGPGAGKTILGLHFLAAGAAAGESSLFISLEEPEDRIRQNAAALGLDLSHVHFLDLGPSSEFFEKVQTYDIFSPAEVEREPLTARIVQRIEETRPRRVFFDPLTQFRYLSSDTFQFRKQVLSFLRYLVERGATVLFTSESTADQPDEDLQFLADGVIHLSFAPEGRTIAVTKFRGSGFWSGRHSMNLGGQGIEVFPRLVPGEHVRGFRPEAIAFGIPELDELLHGGVERGTVTIITGPTGTGKTTLGLQLMKEAAGRGERSVAYTFEEPEDTIIRRCEAVHIPISAMIAQGTLSLVRVEPLRFSADQFAATVRDAVEKDGARIIMIDSIAGYRLSLRDEDLTTHLHALAKYLQNMGVAAVFINELETITGDFRATEIGISYLADNIIFLRHLEVAGEIRRAIGVLKKRLSDFDKTLREFEISRYGIKVGRPLTNVRGVLSGRTELVDPGSGRVV